MLHSRHENKPYVPSPALLRRRRFQKAKPNLGGARHKDEQPGVEKAPTSENTALTTEDHLLQKGDCDTQLSVQARVSLLCQVMKERAVVGNSLLCCTQFPGKRVTSQLIQIDCLWLFMFRG